MAFKDVILLFFYLTLIRLTTTTKTSVAAMSAENQDLEHDIDSTYAFINYTYWIVGLEPIQSENTEETACYGEGGIFNVTGKLVHIKDIGENGIVTGGDYACSPNIQGTRSEPIPPLGVIWIALVQRGGCTFEEKVKNVHAKGAAGVIIYNDKPGMKLEKMQLKDKNRNITAVLTYERIGYDMAFLVDTGHKMNASIIKGREIPYNSSSSFCLFCNSHKFYWIYIITFVIANKYGNVIN